MTSSTPNTSASTSLPASALPADHLDHPESWATGGDPATNKQLAFVSVLEKQHEVHIDPEELEGIDKTEASELIDGLKKGESVLPHHAGHEDKDKRSVEGDDEGEGESSRKKRKVNANEDKVEQEEDGELNDVQETSANKIATGEHLDHPDSWVTGSDPATSKQLAFIAVLEKQHPDVASSLHHTDDKKEQLDKTEASEIIDELKKGETVDIAGEQKEEGVGAEKKKVFASKSSPLKATATKAAETDSKDDGEEPGTDEYLSHPEGWATGGDPATSKQLAYLAVLEKQKGLEVHGKEDDGLGKTGASQKIEKLKGK